jgi:hypothetical protein
MPFIFKNITLEQIESEEPKTLWVARHTCWWTHRQEDLSKNPEGKMCDPRGGDVDPIGHVKDYLRRMKLNAREGVYGKHGIAAFMAAHNDNCKVSERDERSTCMQFWRDYTAQIDLQNAVPKPKILLRDVDLTLGEIPGKAVQHEANPRIGRQGDGGDGPCEGEDEDEGDGEEKEQKS